MKATSRWVAQLYNCLKIADSYFTMMVDGSSYETFGRLRSWIALIH